MAASMYTRIDKRLYSEHLHRHKVRSAVVCLFAVSTVVICKLNAASCVRVRASSRSQH